MEKSGERSPLAAPKGEEVKEAPFSLGQSTAPWPLKSLNVATAWELRLRRGGEGVAVVRAMKRMARVVMGSILMGWE